MRAIASKDEQKAAGKALSFARGASVRSLYPGANPALKSRVEMSHNSVDVSEALRNLHLLMRAHRLYESSHPKIMSTLDIAYDSLRAIAATLDGLELRVERGGIVVPKLNDAPLIDARGEFHALATDLGRAGIQTLSFAKMFHVGELDTLAHLVQATLLKSELSVKQTGTGWWTSRLLENRVEGILVNLHTIRKVDTILASLVAALVAYGGNSPVDSGDAPIRTPELADLKDTLRLLGRLTPPLEGARGLSPEEGARTIHAAMEQASKETVRMLLSSMSQYSPQEDETPQPYLLRLSTNLICEFLTAEFSGGTLTPVAVKPVFLELADVLVAAGGYAGPHSSQHLSALATTWSTEIHKEQFLEKFWLELPAREKSAVLRGAEVWCIPVVAILRTLTQLSEAGTDAPRREARNILLNYARRVESPDPSVRRAVAAGLGELIAIIETLWPNQLPEDLNRGALKSLEKESTPEVSALLSGFVETLSRIAVSRGDYAAFETILIALEQTPSEHNHAQMSLLAHRLVAGDRWLLLVDAALANRALDPVLPRLLQRDTERLLDRLTLLLTEPRGAELVPPMARLLRTIGVPALNLLESRLYEARRQRVVAAIKLLAAADPERLLRGLTRAMASWEWNLQDLAVSELARPINTPSSLSVAFVFSAILQDAHPLVVPMMIDQIGLGQEATAVPLLMEIAAGEHETLREQFVRIKAIEALGRLHAVEAIDLLRALAGKREGLVHSEPAGLRAASEDALAILEDRPSTGRSLSSSESSVQAGCTYVVPRRYVRVPLESPLRAQIEGSQAGLARVKTISLGGAYLQSPRRLNVGDSIKLEVRSGLRKIHFTAVVRNIGPDGSGVEFVHMKDEDRDKLRKLVRRHLPPLK
ncbi:MAG: hypothetical protein NVS9B4_03820 [Candidatus Acidiferrum sp.]